MQTLIDHILTNESIVEVFPGVIDYKISDHAIIFVRIVKKLTTPQNLRKKANSNKYKFRSLTKFVITLYCEDLKLRLESHLNEAPEITSDNFANGFDKFNDCILTVVNKHAPLKNASRKQKRLSFKPWINSELLNAIRSKQKLYKTHFKSGDPDKIKIHKSFANKLTHMRESCKKK